MLQAVERADGRSGCGKGARGGGDGGENLVQSLGECFGVVATAGNAAAIFGHGRQSFFVFIADKPTNGVHIDGLIVVEFFAVIGVVEEVGQFFGAIAVGAVATAGFGKIFIYREVGAGEGA